ncbi:2OG-Fe(II) oxygenase [Pelagibacterales bacterium SAG-MED50]|nr:2OG-Fe(II) oxygenase [Pelagibacterales bacterium SAG-MED50]
MKFIDINRLLYLRDDLNKEFQSKSPFRYLVFDNILLEEAAESIHDSYPRVIDGAWDKKTYLDQNNKFHKRNFENNSLIQKVFDELNSKSFLEWLNFITNIEEPLIADPELFGGGLHQSINGAFLNVHVDYNFHPKTKYHRRINVLIYMNKNWKDEYEGHLELWEINESKQTLLKKISPKFNRCVIFETNEVSFHGHPKPLNIPDGMSRKSLATYYYTKTRPSSEISHDHNTIYVNTEGSKGNIKRFKSGVKSFLERINKK